MKQNRFLSDALVRKYSKVDRLEVAKATGASPKWVRDVLAGREPATGDMAKAIVVQADKQCAP